ncbi:MAG: hypothetical protein AAF658_12545 [Myxococcota bacterium]
MGRTLWGLALLAVTFSVTPSAQAQEKSGIALTGTCPFATRLLRQVLLLESKGTLEIRPRPPFDYRITCRGRSAILFRDRVQLRRVEIETDDDAAAARLVALSVVETLLSPPAPPVPPPEPLEPEPEPEPEPKVESAAPPEIKIEVLDDDAARAEWQLGLSATVLAVENASRWGVGPSFEVRRALPKGWRLDGGLGIAWLREDVNQGRISETRGEISLAVATPRLGTTLDLRAAVGARIAYSELSAEASLTELQGRAVDGWSYGPSLKLELAWPRESGFTLSSEVGSSLAQGVAVVDQSTEEFLSGTWLRFALGWALDV